VDSAVQLIKGLLARPEFTETPASLALLQGLALAARVRAALRSDEETRDVDITIDSADGALTLRGIVVDEDERAAAGRVAAATAGVKSVDNQLRVMARSKLFTSSKN
jgi:hypothetical protein